MKADDEEYVGRSIDRKNAILNRVYVVGIVVFGLVTAGLLVMMIVK